MFLLSQSEGGMAHVARELLKKELVSLMKAESAAGCHVFFFFFFPIKPFTLAQDESCGFSVGLEDR